MTHARVNHAAALLPDGRVLVVGGVHGRPPTADIEMWDPATSTFSVVASLPQARIGGASALVRPDGSVLIANGVDCPSDPSVDDPCADIDRLATDVYDPSSGLRAGPRMFDDRDATMVPLPDGRVLFLGIHGYRGPLAGEILDPVSGEFADAGRTEDGQRGISVATALTDGRVLVAIGGSRLVVWQPTTGFVDAGALLTLRHRHAAVRLPDGRVLIAGGATDVGAVSSTEIWDPLTGRLSVGPSMTMPRAAFSMIVLADGRVLAIGGEGGAAAAAEILE